MSLLNYTKHLNPADNREMLQKIHAFASAQSWNIIEYKTAHDWSTGWIAGDGTYLDILSYGQHNSQHLHYRLFAPLGSGNDAWVYLCAVQPVQVTAEVLATGNGTLTNFTGNFTNTPIVKFISGEVTISYTIGATVYTGTDDGAGAITGTNISSGTINYLTGAYDITFSTAPDNATDITVDYKNTGYDSTSATPPYEQNNMMVPARVSYAPYTMPACWIFGNGYQIIFVAHIHSNGQVSALHLGSVDCFNSAEKEGNFFSTWQELKEDLYWYNYSYLQLHAITPWCVPSSRYVSDTYILKRLLYEGVIVDDYSDNAVNTRLGLDAYTSYFAGYAGAVNRNNFTGKRVLIKPLIYVKQAGGNWIPFGTFPIYWIYYNGLTIGQELTYGTEKYIVFPEALHERANGFAIRIA